MNRSGQKLISICLASYNNGMFLRQALDSILSQTYKNIEIIVGDNASTDDTPAILASYDDPRMTCIRQEATIGCLDHWNALVKASSADIIAVFHADDVYHHDIVEKQVAALHGHDSVGAVFCLDRLIDEEGEYVREGVNLPRRWDDYQVLKFHDVLSEIGFRSNSFLVAPTFMAKKHVFEKVGYFDENEAFGASIGGAGDVEMWLRIARKFDIVVVPQRLIDRRISRHQGSRQYECSRITPANNFLVLDQYLFDAGTDVSQRVLKQYAFNKQWDNVVIAVNMIHRHLECDAKAALKKISWGSLFGVVFYDYKNIVKVVLAVVLRFMVGIGLAQHGAHMIEFVKRKHNNF